MRHIFLYHNNFSFEQDLKKITVYPDENDAFQNAHKNQGPAGHIVTHQLHPIHSTLQIARESRAYGIADNNFWQS